MLAFYCQQLDVLPIERGPVAARHLPGLSRGEHLCEAYEFYRLSVLRPLISFEHAVLLVTELTRAEALVLKICERCAALFLEDPLGTPHCDCTHCRPTYHLPVIPGDPAHTDPLRDRPLQLPLFCDCAEAPDAPMRPESGRLVDGSPAACAGAADPADDTPNDAPARAPASEASATQTDARPLPAPE